MTTIYNLGDTPTAHETGGAPVGQRLVGEFVSPAHRHFGAIATGERRAPKKGEWYLSGAIATAYRAPNDLTTVFQIAKLVRVKREIKEIITIIPMEIT